MGYYSRVLHGNDLVARYRGSKTQLTAEQREVIARAEAAGLKLAEAEGPDHQERVAELVRKLNEKLATRYWLQVQEIDDDGNVYFSDDGDSFRAYDFERDLKEVIRAFREEGNYSLEGTLYLEGEAVGDVRRFKIASDGTVAHAQAKLVFPDGEVFTGPKG